jgi:hypothetical protein
MSQTTVSTAGGRKWDVLVEGRIQSALETADVHALIGSRRLVADSMVRPAGSAEWRRLDQFPDLAVVFGTHQEEARKARYQEYAYWKCVVVAAPIAVACAMWANIFNPFLENWAQYFSLLPSVLIRYLVLVVGAAVFMNWYHHRLVQRGFHWGFWRYSRAGVVGAVVGALMFISGTPPFLPLLPILGEMICAELMILAMVMFFRLLFEKGFKADPA